MKKIKNIILALVVSLSALFVATPAMAAGQCAGGVSSAECNKICNDTNLDDYQKEVAGCNIESNNIIQGHIQSIINTAIAVIGIVAVFVIVFAGQRFMTAQGDPAQIKKAKDMVFYAVIALIVATIAGAAVLFVSGAIGK